MLNFENYFDSEGNINRFIEDYFDYEGNCHTDIWVLVTENVDKFPIRSDIAAIYFAVCYGNGRQSPEQLFTDKWE